MQKFLNITADGRVSIVDIFDANEVSSISIPICLDVPESLWAHIREIEQDSFAVAWPRLGRDVVSLSVCGPISVRSVCGGGKVNIRLGGVAVVALKCEVRDE